MTNTSHTLGPWHRNIRSNGKYPVVFAGRCQHVAVIDQQVDSRETEANIDLIATAPELLEAAEKALILLKQCVEQAKAGIVPIVTLSAFQDIRIIEGCIAKAKGE